jgi:hypothetical protein
MTKINNYEFIELVVPYQSGATRFQFPDQPQLRFVNMLNLTAYFNQMPNFSVLSNNELPAFPEFINASLVLYYNDKESVDRMPLISLNNNIYSSGIFDRAAFAGQTIVWAKSYLQFSNPITTNWENYTGPISFCFGVYYA